MRHDLDRRLLLHWSHRRRQIRHHLRLRRLRGVLAFVVVAALFFVALSVAVSSVGARHPPHYLHLHRRRPRYFVPAEINEKKVNLIFFVKFRHFHPRYFVRAFPPFSAAQIVINFITDAITALFYYRRHYCGYFITDAITRLFFITS